MRTKKQKASLRASLKKSEYRSTYAFIKAEAEKHGVVITRGSEFTNTFIRRRPTGIFGLDVALNGGWGCGTFGQIIGPDSVGKNDLVFRSCAANQRIYGDQSKILFCTFGETTLDKAQARNLGFTIPLTDPEISVLEGARRQPFSPEEKADLRAEIGEVLQISGMAMEDVLETALRFIATGAFQLAILDSVGGMVSRAALDADIGGGKEAGLTRAAALGQFCAKSFLHFHRGVETVVLLLNQFRAELNSMSFGPQTRQSGGWAIRHAKCADVELRRFKHRLETGKRWDEQTKSPSRNYELWGTGVEWRVLKAKAGAHEGGIGRFIRYFTEHEGWKPWDINEIPVIRKHAEAEEILVYDKSRSKWRLPKLDESGRDFLLAKDDVGELLTTNLDYRQALCRAIMARVLERSGHIIATD